jgi:inorganic triphosphatase YgiF
MDRATADELISIGDGRATGGASKSALPAKDGEYVNTTIELELKHGNPADLFKIARDILNIVPAHLEFKTKPERGYELVDPAPACRRPECRVHSLKSRCR